MLTTVCTVLSLGIAIGGVIGVILKGFFKTNKEANSEYNQLKSEILKQVEIERKEYIDKLDKEKNNMLIKINNLEIQLDSELDKRNKDIKDDFKQLSKKIDDMGNTYVTISNFNTYTDSIHQLFEIYSERTIRLEGLVTKLSDNINEFIRKMDK